MIFWLCRCRHDKNIAATLVWSCPEQVFPQILSDCSPWKPGHVDCGYFLPFGPIPVVNSADSRGEWEGNAFVCNYDLIWTWVSFEWHTSKGSRWWTNFPQTNASVTCNRNCSLLTHFWAARADSRSNGERLLFIFIKIYFFPSGHWDQCYDSVLCGPIDLLCPCSSATHEQNVRAGKGNRFSPKPLLNSHWRKISWTISAHKTNIQWLLPALGGFLNSGGGHGGCHWRFARRSHEGQSPIHRDTQIVHLCPRCKRVGQPVNHLLRIAACLSNCHTSCLVHQNAWNDEISNSCRQPVDWCCLMFVEKKKVESCAWTDCCAAPSEL